MTPTDQAALTQLAQRTCRLYSPLDPRVGDTTYTFCPRTLKQFAERLLDRFGDAAPKETQT